MEAITYFNAYKKARDKMSFYQAQQGGDYSARKKKVERQAAKFEQGLINVMLTHITALRLARPFVQDMIGIASSARLVLPLIDDILEQEGK